jgi:hypothetical protein
VSVDISVKRNFGSLVDLEFVTTDDMRQIGILLRERIVRRTRQGEGPDGPFDPLSPRYADQKQKALGTSSPDLTVSGNMLNDITITEVESDGITARVRLGWVK